tara:strand:- start:15 stop:380 length:366 start_codon:yes stop_codon:yes gene_type:complete
MDDNSINLQYIQQKPWGNFENFIKSKNYLVKILNIEVGHEISLQKHRFRDEHWVILQGSCIITNGANAHKGKENDYFFIKKNSVHNLKNTGNNQLKILEVQFGQKISEKDITRLSDPYNRR